MRDEALPQFTRGNAWGPKIGSALVGMLFAVSGFVKIGKFEALAGVLAGKGVPWPWVTLGAVIALEIAGGAALILGWQARKAAAALAVFVIAATLLFHAFWTVDATSFQNQLNHFLKNLAILGALLSLAVAPTKRV